MYSASSFALANGVVPAYFSCSAINYSIPSSFAFGTMLTSSILPVPKVQVSAVAVALIS